MVTLLDDPLAVIVKTIWEAVNDELVFFGWVPENVYFSDVVRSILSPSTRLRLQYFL